MKQKTKTIISGSLRKNKSFQEDFKTFFSLNIDQIEKLSSIGESTEGFSISEESIVNNSSELGIKEGVFESIIGLIRFLYTSAFSKELDAADVAREICEFAKELDIENPDNKNSAMKKLFSRKESYDYKILVGESEGSGAPLLTAIGIECEIRAITDPTDDKILGFIPLALAHIKVLDPLTQDEKALIFQMKEEHIDSFIEYLQRDKKILSELNSRFTSGNP